MARLKKRGDIWHARVRWIKNGKEKEKQINLGTQNKSEAYARLSHINYYEVDIKNGMDFDFPWFSNVERTRVKRFTILDAAKQWMSRRESILAKKTIELNQDGLNYFLMFIGNSHPLESILTSQIEHLASLKNVGPSYQNGEHRYNAFQNVYHMLSTIYGDVGLPKIKYEN